MKIDLHCHSKYSQDNFLEPEDLIQQAIRIGLDGVCFTEHYSLLPLWVTEKIKVPEGFFIFRGIEISTSRGHLLAYGLENDFWNLWSSNTHLDLSKVVETVHQRGGICVAAHPFRGWDSFGDEVLTIDGLDAIETHNGLNTEEQNQKAIQIAQLRNLPSVVGSDCHGRDHVGRVFTEFDNPVRTLRELVEEIKKGNCRGMTWTGETG